MPKQSGRTFTSPFAQNLWNRPEKCGVKLFAMLFPDAREAVPFMPDDAPTQHGIFGMWTQRIAPG
jgi:hypothetical protein